MKKLNLEKLNLDKVKEMAGKLLPKKEDGPEAEPETAAEAVVEAAEVTAEAAADVMEAAEAAEETAEAAEEAVEAAEETAEAVMETAEAAEEAAEPVEEPEEAPVAPEKPVKPEKAPKPAKPAPKKAEKQPPKTAKAKQAPKGKAPKKADAKLRFSLPTADELKSPAFIVPAASLLLLILAWCFTKSAVTSGILGALSAVAALYVLFPDIKAAVQAKDWRSGLLLLVIAAVLYAVAGGIPGAAAALLLWIAGQKALELLKAKKCAQLSDRRAASPLAKELPSFEETPVLSGAREHTLQSYFTFLAVFLAAVVAVIAVLTKAGFTGALRRAAVILLLGSTASFFAGFPFGDLSAALSAGNNGVLFRGSALSRALGLKLCCVSEAEPEMFGDVAVYPTMPEKLDGEALVRLAAVALSRSSGLWAEKVASICDAPAAEGLETRELEGYGVAAKLNNLTVICGSAEFMRKAELPMLPFRDGENLLHIGVNNFYAGCLELGEAELNEDAADAALAESGFFRFDDTADAAAKRQSGECILFAAPDGRPEGCGESDLYVASGAYQTGADVVLDRRGAAGILDLTAELKKAGKLRQLLVTLAVYVKAVLFLLAIFGACPLWLAVLLELGVSAFGVYLGAKAPKVKE